MKWFRKIPQEVKNQVIVSIKDRWLSVAQASVEYWVWTKAIYRWLKQDTEWELNLWNWSWWSLWWRSKSDIITINRLQKEKQELLKIIWALTVINDKIKKKELFLW